MDKNVRKLISLMEQRRKQEGLSQRGLSELIGVSFATLSRLERYETEPDESTKSRIANWLGDDASKVGIKVESVVEVHFRAAKNIDSLTVRTLADLAKYLKHQHGTSEK